MKKTRLKAWMDAHGYTHMSLAAELNFSYEYIYKIAMAKDKRMTESFQLRFINRFGAQEASKLFHVAPHLLGSPLAVPA